MDYMHYQRYPHIHGDLEPAFVVRPHEPCCPDEEDECVCVTSGDVERWNDAADMLSALSGVTPEDIEKIELIVHKKKNPQNPIDANCTILINNKNLEINEFTTKIVSNSIKAMVNSIKTEDNVKKIDFEISNIVDGDLTKSDILLKTNDHDVEINKFTQGILKETIYAIINSLKLEDEEVHEIKINVEEG